MHVSRCNLVRTSIEPHDRLRRPMAPDNFGPPLPRSDAVVRRHPDQRLPPIGRPLHGRSREVRMKPVARFLPFLFSFVAALSLSCDVQQPSAPAPTLSLDKSAA